MSAAWKAAGGLAGMRLILVACHVAQVQRDAPRSANEDVSDSFFQRFWAENATNRIAARNKIVASVCPQLCSVFDAKLALLLVLLGGVQRQHGDSNIRGNCHMLLVGDPGILPDHATLHT
jgi:DNA helicase MCM9